MNTRKKAQLLATAVCAQIASLQSATPDSVEQAKFIAQSLTAYELPIDKLGIVKREITAKMVAIQNEGDDRYSQETLQHLAAADAALDAQIEICKKYLDFAMTGTIDDSLVAGAALAAQGGPVGLDQAAVHAAPAE